MPNLQTMPQLIISADELKEFGLKWNQNGGRLQRTPPFSSMQLGNIFDAAVGKAMAEMLGNIPIVKPGVNKLIPQEENCVEVGPIRIVGGIRPQNFDVGYRPDGIRIAFDSKTLNDVKSVQKNYQNMINDLGTEATTVHTRFPYALVGFLVAVPKPCLTSPQKEALTETLERITQRSSPLDSAHKAEVISLVVWDPNTGEIDDNWPKANSPVRWEKFSDQMFSIYEERYKGLPPLDS